MSLCVVRVGGDRPPGGVDRLVVTTPLTQAVSEARQARGVIGVGLEHLPEVLLRVGPLFHVVQGPADTCIEKRRTRSQAIRLLELHESFVPPFEVARRLAHIVMQAGLAWLKGDRS